MYHRSFMRPPFEQLVKNRRFRNENYAGVRWPNCIQINTVVDDTEIRIDNLSYENSNLIKFLTYFRNFIIKINNFFSIFALTCSNTVAPADQWRKCGVVSNGRTRFRCFLSVTEPSSMATNDHDERKDRRSKNACELVVSNNFSYMIIFQEHGNGFFWLVIIDRRADTRGTISTNLKQKRRTSLEEGV